MVVQIMAVSFQQSYRMCNAEGHMLSLTNAFCPNPLDLTLFLELFLGASPYLPLNFVHELLL